MKNELTAKRLRLALSNKNMKPQELSDKSGVNKASVSQYVNGSHKPSNISAGKMADILDVDPLWLMGFDVPMKRQVSDEDIGNAFANDNLFEVIDNISALSPQEKNHFTNYLQLLEINRKKADDYVEQLLSLQQMDTELQINAAHARTDIDVPEGTDTSDNDIMDDEDF